MSKVIDTVRTYTSCSEAYDGFGTVTVEIVGMTTGKRPQVIRAVETPERHVEWQRMRYWSGAIHLVADDDEWSKLVECGLVNTEAGAGAK